MVLADWPLDAELLKAQEHASDVPVGSEPAVAAYDAEVVSLPVESTAVMQAESLELLLPLLVPSGLIGVVEAVLRKIVEVIVGVIILVTHTVIVVVRGSLNIQLVWVGYIV